MTTFEEYYKRLLDTYYKKGKIGKVKPYNIAHARKIAWTIASRLFEQQFLNEIEKEINTPICPSRQPTEGLTGCPNWCQLRLF